MDELGNHTDAGEQIFPRKHLRFIEDENAVCHIVELPASGGFICEEGFKELNICRYDQRLVPVFSGEAARVHLVIFKIILEVVMVLQQVAISNDIAECGRRLLNDRGIGDDIDHTAHLMTDSMLQRKGQGGKGFPAAGRYGQSKEAAFSFGHLQAALQDFAAHAVEFVCGMLKFLQLFFQLFV